MSPKFVLGIDLGTTNSVLAYTPLDGDAPRVALLPIPQVTAPGVIEPRPALPSFVYLAQEHEARAKAYDLPWRAHADYAVGEVARRQAAEAPQRTIGAAKSWLAHSGVDRRQAILPWKAPDDVPRISPVTASRRYLEHLLAAWEQAYPDAPAREQVVVLTVPASFDASARELTREAALAAGLPADLVLLEEPQAAVYSWLDQTGNRWRRLLQVSDKLLVCDVGGGTSDFTLVGVAEEGGELALRRLAVGNHLLVGGDNMDLALAHFAAEQFAAKGVKLNPWQSVSLWHSCRVAKETLLTPGGPDKHSLAVLGRGGKLIGGTVSLDLERDRVAPLLLDGFFPPCQLSDKPARRRMSGFQEIGLPFEADPAVTKHLAAFLTLHGGQAGPARPTHVLFNGGVFKAGALRTRALEVLRGWFGDEAVNELAGAHDLDFAVARGAAYYGWAKQRGGVRIRGGISRAYYVGIETAGLAIPGALRPLRALCVAPLGMEEGQEADIPSEEIGLVLGEQAHFRFFCSPNRKQDQGGDVLSTWTDEELVETAPLETTLAADAAPGEDYVPVKFHTKITELGMFELWCQSTRDAQRWKLEFSVREEE